MKYINSEQLCDIADKENLSYEGLNKVSTIKNPSFGGFIGDSTSKSPQTVVKFMQTK